MRKKIILASLAIAMSATATWLWKRSGFRYSVEDIEAERVHEASLANEAKAYFPDGVFSARADSHMFSAKWYTSFLMAMDEPSLFDRSTRPDHDVYRFTWLRTFHRPVILRVDMTSGQNATFIVKVSDGAGGYIPGRLVRNERRRIDAAKAKEMSDLFEKFSFLDLPPFIESDAAGLDGARWVIEAVIADRYHVASRWSPTDGPIEAIGSLMIAWAGGRDLTEVY